MNIRKVLTFLVVFTMVAVWATPASAQIGQTDVSSFTIQNVDTTAASVTVIFVKEDGQQLTPNPLNGNKANPFTLQPNESWEVVVSQVPGLSSGRYSVIIGSTKKVIAISTVGGRGSRAFNGSYQGFAEGAPTFYLPGVVFNYYGWYSLMTVQNLGTVATNVNVAIKCTNTALNGTLTFNSLQPMASHTFVLKPGQTDSVVPSGFNANSACNGSATITNSAGQSIVATDNQTIPASGRTQSYSGVANGASTLFVPALYYNYSGWSSSLNILKLSSGDTTVTVRYSNGGTSTCNLTNASPSCLKVMSADHPTQGYFAAKITTSPAAQLVAIANASKPSTNQAQTYNAAQGGGAATPNWGIPAVYDLYYNWKSSFTCQNIGSVDTKIRITYEDKPGNVYDHPNTLQASTNESVEVAQANEPFLTAGYRGAVTIQALAPGASITCIMNYTNGANIASQPGDWSTSNNAFAK